MAANAFPKHSESVLEALLAGASEDDAAREVGLTERTVARWLAKGRARPEGPYGDFARRVDEQRAGRKLPPDDAPLTREELIAIAARAARKGSVPAMRLYAEQFLHAKDTEAPAGAMEKVDELARRRQRAAGLR